MHNSTIRYASWAKHSLWLNDVYTCDRLNSLLPLTSLPAKGSVLTQMPSADAWAVRSSASQNLRRVRRTLHFDHREINAVNSSKNIEIYLVQRTAKAGHKISGQKRAAKSHLSGCVLDIYLAMSSDSKHCTKYIHELTKDWRLIDINCLNTIVLFLETCYF